MTEKTTFGDINYASTKDEYPSHKEQTIHDEAPIRQGSVALNIVDNPLRVRSLCILQLSWYLDELELITQTAS